MNKKIEEEILAMSEGELREAVAEYCYSARNAKTPEEKEEAKERNKAFFKNYNIDQLRSHMGLNVASMTGEIARSNKD